MRPSVSTMPCGRTWAGLTALLSRKEKSTSVRYDIYLEDTLAQQEDFSMEEEIFNEMGRKQVRDMVNQLEEREKEILKLRYGLDGYEIHTLEEIGNTLNITRERVRQIEKKTLQKLRSKYTKELKGDLF